MDISRPRCQSCHMPAIVTITAWDEDGGLAVSGITACRRHLAGIMMTLRKQCGGTVTATTRGFGDDQ